MPATQRLTRLALAGILAMHSLLLVHSAWRNAPTCDEIGHLYSGIVHLQYGDFSMYRVNPPLPRMLGALPALLLHPVVDIEAVRQKADKPLARAEFALGDDFARDNADRLLPMLRLARLSGVLWSVCGALLVFAWSRRAFGHRAALLGAALWSFCPLVLAHAPLLTPDVPAAVAGLGAAFAFEIALRRPSWHTAAGFGIALGIALLTKLTAMLFLPVFVGIWLWRRWRARASMPAAAAQVAAAMAIALLVLDAGYAFHDCPTRIGRVPFVSSALSGLPPARSAERTAANRFESSIVGSVWLPVPESLVRGVDVQRRDFEVGIPSYLRGEWRRRGWWYFYLYGLAVKLPLGYLALFALGGLAMVVKRKWRDPTMVTLAALPAVVLLVVSANTGFTVHLRYVLPALPFLLIGGSAAGLLLHRSTARWAALVGAAFASGAAQTVAIHPHELSYFNELAGGPENGDWHLVDSNMDWGQDLLELRRWLGDNPQVEGLKLAYFGAVPPEAFGIEYSVPERSPNACDADIRRYDQLFGPTPGYYAISVGYLRGARLPVANGRWGRDLVAPGDFSYFQTLRPVARAGYSILVYHLDLEQANALRRGLDVPPLDPDVPPPS